MQGPTIYTQEKTSVIRVTEHSHPSSRTYVETIFSVSKIKNDGGTKLPGQVVRDVLVETSDEVKAALPSCTNLIQWWWFRTLVVIPYTWALDPFANTIMVIPYTGERNHHRVISTSLVLMLFDSPSGYSECGPTVYTG